MPGVGYSATPLPKKLGIAPGMRVVVLNAPGDYRNLVAPWPEQASLSARADAQTDLVHLFVAERAVLVEVATASRTLCSTHSP